MNKPLHLPRLDGLRGVAALGVLIFHLRIFYLMGPMGPEGINPLKGIPGAHWLQINGWMLVDLFFVVSGYVFAHCYLSNGKMREGVSLKQFGWARFARLWPLHGAMLVFATIVLAHDPNTTWQNILLSAAMLHALIPAQDALNAPAWSISVECLCYLVFALAATRGRRIFDAVCVISMIAGAAMIMGDAGSQFGRGLLGFFAGVTLCRSSTKTDCIPLLIIIAVALIPFFTPTEGWGFVVNAAIGWPAVILLGLRTRFLEHNAMKWIGDRSYAIYLSHVPILITLGSLAWGFGELSRGALAIITIAIIGIILTVANVLYETLERPAQKKLNDLARARQEPDMDLQHNVSQG